ncbi:MAG: glycosyltransferase family 2 protein, partial [Rhodobacteraceae bacterium]|nr:glycosyltransferase family 2 protein [Paracoccaceae bacterium]
MRCSIIACARNEGPFLVEWISHHLSLGFEKIFVATNDCQDGTDSILDLISRDWPVFRIENSDQIDGLTYQRSAV